MALTLAQAALLSNDVVRQGVIEAIVKESGLLERLPFIEMVGHALKYNRELTLAGAEFFAVGSTWTESTPTVEQKSAALKILGGDADVDKFLAQTRANGQDLEAGRLGLTAREEGPAAQTFAMGTTTTPGALSLKKLDEVIDAVRPGKPDFLMMTRTQRRGISAYARSLTSPVTYQPSELGQRVMFYDGIPIVVNDHQLHTEVITNGGLALFSVLAMARLGGVSSGDVVA